MCDYFELCKYADAGACKGEISSCVNENILKNLKVDPERKPEPETKKIRFFRKNDSEIGRIFSFFASFTMVLSLLLFLLFGYGWLVSVLTAVFINVYLRFAWRLCDWFRVLVKLVNEKRGVSD